jgi:hypothetical protein
MIQADKKQIEELFADCDVNDLPEYNQHFIKSDIPIYNNEHDEAYDKVMRMMELDNDEFIKNDSNKPRYSLIPPIAEEEWVKVLTFGAQKYSPENWRKVDDLSRYVDAAMRHISSYRKGDKMDIESGFHHLAHAMCCLSFIVEIESTDTHQ